MHLAKCRASEGVSYRSRAPAYVTRSISCGSAQRIDLVT